MKKCSSVHRSSPNLLAVCLVSSALWGFPGSKALAAGPVTNCLSFTNFVSTNGLSLTGVATVTNGVLRLTPARDSQLGNAWLPQKQPVTGGFDTSFRFRITTLGNILGNEPGGDGITFTVQNVGPTNQAWAV